MKAHTLTYRGKKYEFPMENGVLTVPDKIRDLPKAVLLIMHFGASNGAYSLGGETADAVYDAIGIFVDDDGLNDKGKRVFKSDPEVLAASLPPPPATPTTTPDTTMVSAASGAEQAAASPDEVGTCALPMPPVTIPLSTLLEMIRAFLLRFMVFPDPAQAVACALWVVHTWVIDAFGYTPYLFIYSPMKRCGKTRLLNCFNVLVSRSWSIVAGTEATIMRKVDAECPTLLFDEIDTVYGSSHDRSRESLRAVLNAGFLRGAKVPRCAGSQIIEYSVFCAKAFAGIGDSLPSTVKDRSIRIQLMRRSRDQHIDSLRHPDFGGISARIVECLASWAADEEVIRQLANARPAIPHELGDRAADISEPLFAIADLAGGEWPEAVRDALVALLRMSDDEEADEPEVRLLGAIWGIFVAEKKTYMLTVQILRKLAACEEEEEWTTKWPRQISAGNTRGPAAKMARLLRRFGIKSISIRLPDGSTPKGYRLEDFTDAFARYLPPLPQNDATTPQPSLEQGAVDTPPTAADTEETNLHDPES